jgi:hypothetical protein
LYYVILDFSFWTRFRAALQVENKIHAVLNYDLAQGVPLGQQTVEGRVTNDYELPGIGRAALEHELSHSDPTLNS